jgi:ABC-type phosphate transport system permease subunit
MAQGEPLIWLTGGALATCVAMIIGLLSLVIWSGVPTFWPRPLVSVELFGGRKVLGEVTRVETYPLTAAILPTLDAAEIEPAKKHLAGRERVLVKRRLLRTGNFELSGDHYRVVPDFAVQPGTAHWPEWAVTVERLEWGRFFGEPVRFTDRHRRSVVSEEGDLAAIIQFVDANQWRVPADETERFQQSVTSLRLDLEQIRQSAVARFLAEFPADDQRPQQVAIDGGPATPREEVAPDQNVTEVHLVTTGPEASWRQFQTHHVAARERFYEYRRLQKHDIGRINSRLEDARLNVRKAELTYEVSLLPQANELHSLTTAMGDLKRSTRDVEATIALAKRKLPADAPLLEWCGKFASAQQAEIQQQLDEISARQEELLSQQRSFPAAASASIDRFLDEQRAALEAITEIQRRSTELAEENARYELTMATAEGQEQTLKLADVVRAYRANHLTLGQKLQIYADRWWEYLTDEPREANSEGGVLPAIWGTVAMTMVMSLLVVPFGVLSALYLREYARAGWLVSAIRVSISNLAGVPSIVFGVFGLGFFCYLLGAYLDGGATNAGLVPLAPRVWWVCLFALALTGVVAFGTGLLLLTGGRYDVSRRRRLLGYGSLLLWIASLILAVVVIFLNPNFGGLFPADLPNPTLGKGGLIWASLTLALLTLPVVIVATEEALSSVPNSLREGSYACGGSKWQTIRRIVLPHAMPGIMTGMILAMARGAGEVAPLMLVGAVKLQPELPLDGEFPFLHMSRSFMHLAFHIFDLGFQSQNVEAAKPMVFTTTMLLIAIIVALNFAAVWIRSMLRKRLHIGQF